MIDDDDDVEFVQQQAEPAGDTSHQFVIVDSDEEVIEEETMEQEPCQETEQPATQPQEPVNEPEQPVNLPEDDVMMISDSESDLTDSEQDHIAENEAQGEPPIEISDSESEEFIINDSIDGRATPIVIL